ncbi:MAG: carbohydrate-binding family 9-like protein [Acidobacteriota bacterium]|nr:carbohydrate-binding family 9-like protein [Acidobacteriota bacterium]
MKNTADITQGIDEDTAVAQALISSVDDDGFPIVSAWTKTQTLRFDADWKGENADPERATEVRLLWTPANLYLKFRARYRTITSFDNADVNGRRDHLWDRDVVEVFLQPDPSQLGRYKEFEVSPNGYWIDLEIENGGHRDFVSGMKRRVRTDETARSWTAEVAIPMKSLVERFDANTVWHVNFFRVEGASEPRFYSAWRATNTPQPNFHVPEAFGKLIFEPAQ